METEEIKSSPAPVASKTQSGNSVAKLSESSAFGIRIIVGSSILLIGLYRAIDLRWVSDDAFVTFRYVHNLLTGLGPVYNASEHVEGYTHFLWFILLSICGLFDLEPVTASMWMGILCYGGILGVFLLISKKEWIAQKSLPGSPLVYIPLASILIALNYDMAVWATGGLETALYTFLISVALYTWFYTGLEWRMRLVTTGGLLLLITLTRPDGALFMLTALALLITKLLKDKKPAQSIIRDSVIFTLPFVVVGIPYLLWKYSYYGDVFPTTYYAKSGSMGNIDRGFFYVSIFTRMYWSSIVGFLILPVAAYLLAIKGSVSKNQLTIKNQSVGSPYITAIVAILVYLGLFVIRSGGDFMASRFIIPVLPLIYYVIEQSLNRLPFRMTKVHWAIASAFVISLIAENTYRDAVVLGAQIGPLWNDHNLEDEHFGYSAKINFNGGKWQSKMDILSACGRFLEPFFRGLPATVEQTGGCMVAYYGEFQTVIEKFGLTDKYISHLPVSRPGKIGHEKMAPLDYLIKRGVTFSFLNFWPADTNPPAQNVWDMAWFKIPEAGIIYKVRLVQADTALFYELIRRLDSAKAQYYIPDFRQITPDWVARTMPNTSLSNLKAGYQTLQSIYFTRYPDPSLQRQIENTIAQKQTIEDSAAKAHSTSPEFDQAGEDNLRLSFEGLNNK